MSAKTTKKIERMMQHASELSAGLQELSAAYGITGKGPADLLARVALAARNDKAKAEAALAATDRLARLYIKFSADLREGPSPQPTKTKRQPAPTPAPQAPGLDDSHGTTSPTIPADV